MPLQYAGSTYEKRSCAFQVLANMLMTGRFFSVSALHGANAAASAHSAVMIRQMVYRKPSLLEAVILTLKYTNYGEFLMPGEIFQLKGKKKFYLVKIICGNKLF